MDSNAIANHLFDLYDKQLLTDTEIRVAGQVFNVHRCILTLSGYFSALINGSWSGPAPFGERGHTGLQPLMFEIDTTDETEITADAVAQLIRYLYGKNPEITEESVQSLMVCSSFFDVPQLSSMVADYVFAHLTYDNVIETLRMVYNREYGEPGKLIEDASLAFIHRNAVDIGTDLAYLPLPQQKKILMASELYVQTEFQRYKLALAMKRAYRARLADDLGAFDSRAVPVAYANVTTPAPPCNTPTTSHIMKTSLWTTSMSESDFTPEHALQLHGASTLESFPVYSGKHASPSPRVPFTAPTPTSASFSMSKSVVEVTSEPVPAARTAEDVQAEIRELDAVYEEVFSNIRFMHFTEDQLAEVERDGEIPASLIAKARSEQQQMRGKLEVANRYNVRRLSELDAMNGDEYPDVAAVRDVKWPAFRFGVEISDVFGDAMKPSLEGEPLSTSSERIYFAGSLWCLDLKRYINRPDGTEYVAVYLRRRAVRSGAPPFIPLLTSSKFEDKRDRTTLGFSIRLCGAPGAPTSNSVCGRSQMGKSFGTESETSWGWETYLTTANLTEKPWSTGDKLRFMMVLDML